MKTIKIDMVQENDVLGEDIYTTKGSIILAKGMTLLSSHIKKFEKLGIQYIKIEQSFENMINEQMNILQPKFIEEKNATNCIEATKNIVNNLINTGSISNICEIYKASELMIDDILSNKNIHINISEIEKYDSVTYTHVLSVTILTLYLAKKMRFNRDELKDIAVGCLLHDIGKLYIPLEVLNKPSKLTNEEFNVIKKHPIDGYNIIKKNVPFEIANIALSHHEKYDGSGYPYNRSKNNIHYYAKMCALSDVYDAVTADRPYRKGMQPNEAIELIMGSLGSHFDPEIAMYFLNIITAYPNGSVVHLSNKSKGIVLEQNQNYPLRPKILIYEESGTRLREFKTINLEEQLNIVITKIEKK